MATNEMPFSHPASPDDVHGTSWINNAAGEARPRMTQAAFRAMTRRSQPQGPLPLPVIPAPLVGDRPQAFIEGATNGTGRQFRPSLAGSVLGALAGVAAYNAIKKRR
jgi:hypothetical protein